MAETFLKKNKQETWDAIVWEHLSVYLCIILVLDQMSLTTASVAKGHSQGLMPAVEEWYSAFDKLSQFSLAQI